jgi:hypothetical protein
MINNYREQSVIAERLEELESKGIGYVVLHVICYALCICASSYSLHENSYLEYRKIDLLTKIVIILLN